MDAVISSRTPEGVPNRCAVCGYRTVWIEPSATTRDAPCPCCGTLLWFEQGPDWSMTLEDYRLIAEHEESCEEAGHAFPAPASWYHRPEGLGRRFAVELLRVLDGLGILVLVVLRSRAARVRERLTTAALTAPSAGLWDPWLDG